MKWRNLSLLLAAVFILAALPLAGCSQSSKPSSNLQTAHELLSFNGNLYIKATLHQARKIEAQRIGHVKGANWRAGKIAYPFRSKEIES